MRFSVLLNLDHKFLILILIILLVLSSLISIYEKDVGLSYSYRLVFGHVETNIVFRFYKSINLATPAQVVLKLMLPECVQLNFLYLLPIS